MFAQPKLDVPGALALRNGRSKFFVRRRPDPVPNGTAHSALVSATPVPAGYTELPAAATARTAKILIYSHDTFGLGNIRRTLLLAQTLREEFSNASILLVTGSPVIHSFRIPDRVDYIKLPCLDRVAADLYAPLYLSQHGAVVKQLRQDLLHRSILSFSPDLMIVDKKPGGIDNELLATLEALHRLPQRPQLVLGVRDILDAPERTRRSLHDSHSFALIDRFYDEVWVYGVPEIFDHLAEYQYPAHIAAKTHYCGYLRRPSEPAPKKNHTPRVLVTTGGGADGHAVVEAYLAGLVDLPRRFALRTKVIFGPQMPAADRADLLARYGQLHDVKFRDFKADLTEEYAKADVVVSMAGYNTVCELLSCGKRAVLVPREQPVQEQLIRARKLADMGLFHLVEQSQLTPTLLLETVISALDKETGTPSPIDLDGLPRIRRRVYELLQR